MAGPGTRSRRSAVNVICVARCPLGGYFSTGSDDAICRVWQDSDDRCVSLVDKRFTENARKTTGLTRERRSRRISAHNNGKPFHFLLPSDLSYGVLIIVLFRTTSEIDWAHERHYGSYIFTLG